MNTQLMKIGLDFDGVIVDAAERKVKAASELFGIDIKPSQTKRALLVPSGIMTEEQYRAVQRLVNSMRYGRTMRAIPGALESIKQLMEYGFEIEVITARDGMGLRAARHWLRDNGFDLQRDGRCLPVTGVRNRNKADAARKRGIYLFVDDDLERLVELEGVVPWRVQFSWHYNRHERDKSIMRVDNWSNQLLPRILRMQERSYYMFDPKRWRKMIARCKECGLRGNISIFEPHVHYLYDLRCSVCGSVGLDWTYGDYVNNQLSSEVQARLHGAVYSV